MAAESLVTVEHLCLELKGPAGNVRILKDVSLTVNAGEKVSIVGKSGSGKTSLLLVLAGLERFTSGRVRIAGSDIGAMSEDALAVFRRRTIGIVFQSFHLVPTMTALENVAVPLEFAGEKSAFSEARTALDLVGLAHRMGHLPSQLSGGEQQRVALARAFVMRPRILLADEPTGNLDQENGAQVMRLMLDLHARYGTTLLLVTHDKTIAARCDRTITLADGTVA